jgi:nanoRNase/pAp phosphatase (c-di-AMP/oligoRNAs hydrolase)/CBS domain-containing protein
MHIVTTHKGTDFDGLASVVAANLLFPDVVTVLPGALNPNVHAFLSLHKDLFDFCAVKDIRLADVKQLTIVDTNRWDRLERPNLLKDGHPLSINLFDHHGMGGDIHASWQCQEAVGANITLMLRYLKRYSHPISPIHASLFLTGLYEDTGNLTFSSTRAEDARAAAYFLEKGADLHVTNAFLGPTYGQKQKDILFRMLRKATRIKMDGYTISVNRMTVNGWVSDLSLVVHMYRQILNVDAAFGVFALDGDRCLIIGRSDVDGIDISAIMGHIGGGGHPGAGSALLKAIDPGAVEQRVRELIGESHQASTRIRALMTVPVLTLSPEMTMATAYKKLRGKGYKGAPVMMDTGKLVGILSTRDFKKVKKKKDLERPVKAFMTHKVITISPRDNPGHAAHLMVKHDIGRLPVIEKEELVGIFSRSDAVADFYGLCPFGKRFSIGCRDRKDTFS